MAEQRKQIKADTDAGCKAALQEGRGEELRPAAYSTPSQPPKMLQTRHIFQLQAHHRLRLKSGHPFQHQTRHS